MNTMTFKGYAAQINYSDADACFIGHIAGIADVRKSPLAANSCCGCHRKCTARHWWPHRCKA